MRTRDRLLALEEIPILLQYLYMDHEHKINYHNGVARLTLRMTDTMQIMCKNENFPEIPESDFTDMLSPAYTLNIIEVLKDEPATDFPAHFKNRWDEIKTITVGNVTQNKMRKVRGL